MVNIDNSGLFINGIFTEKTVTVAANTTLAAGTILGEIAASGKLVISASGNSDGSQVPSYVLAQDITNATGAPVDYTNVRVMMDGDVYSSHLIFNGTDTINTIVSGKGSLFTLLKNSGIRIYNVPSIVG